MYAQWRVDLGSPYPIKYVVIYYRAIRRDRFSGFKLYISNSTSRADAFLCYEDDGVEPYPASILKTPCRVNGRYVIVYQDHTIPLDASPILELCEVEVYVCRENTHGNLCQDVGSSLNGGSVAAQTVTTSTVETTTTEVTAPWSLNCGPFWEEDPTSHICYQFSDTLVTMPVAESMCAKAGGQLLTITSIQQQFYIAGRVRGMNSDAVWIGAHNLLGGGWQWIDDSPFSFLNWAPGQPTLRNGELCVSLTTKDALWNDVPCALKNGYICKKKSSLATTKAPLTPAPPLDGQRYGCPGGWTGYRLSCYAVIREKGTWDEAKAACRMEAGADLVSIANEGEQDFVFSQIPQNICYNLHHNDSKCDKWTKDGECYKNPVWMANHCRRSCSLCHRACRNIYKSDAKCQEWAEMGECNKNPKWMIKNCAMSCGVCDSAVFGGFWIGLNDLQYQMTFGWSNGATVEYTNWGKTEPNNFDGKKEDCVSMYLLSGKWSDRLCGNRLPGYICKKPKQYYATTDQSPFAVGCKNDSLGYDASCFLISDKSETWHDAELACAMQGGHMATINDRFVQAFISSELVNKIENFWIGLYQNSTDNVYSWISGSDVRYTHWGKAHTGNEKQTCIAMRAKRPTGLWMNTNCTTSLPYICQLPREGYTEPTTPAIVPDVTTPASEVSCPADWFGFEDNCYRPFVTDRKIWLDARDACRLLGSSLVTIHSKKEQDFLSNKAAPRGGDYWIGLNDIEEELNHKWVDGAAVEFTNWGPDQPDGHLKLWEGFPYQLPPTSYDEDCVVMVGPTYKWNDHPCEDRQPFICKLRKGFTLFDSTTVYPTMYPTPASETCGEDEDWSWYGGFCYLWSPAHGIDARKSWYDARRYCMGKGGDLLSLHSVEEIKFINYMTEKQGFQIEVRGFQVEFWTGLNELSRNGYSWSDTSPLDYVAWDKNEPDDAYGGQLCVAMSASSGLWRDENCNDPVPFICKKSNGTSTPKTVAPTPLINGGCPRGFRGLGNKCFHLGGTDSASRLNWTAAVNRCRAFGKGYDLASITSAREQMFIVTLVAGLDMAFWIGLNRRNRGKPFSWVDNEAVLYTNWQPGEPNNVFNQELCAAMYSHKQKAGRWNDGNCNHSVAYICKGEKSPYIPNERPSQSCANGYQAFAGSCYKLDTVARSWEDSVSFCRSSKGDLLSVQNIYEQAFIEILVSGVTKPFWIGLSDKKEKAKFAWSDGWPVRYTKWGPGEPSIPPAPSIRGCVAMENMLWNDTDCSRPLYAMCEIASAPPPTSPLPATGYCYEGSMRRGDYCYFMDITTNTWANANKRCIERGMKLASIHSKEENDFLMTIMEYKKKYTDAWLGLARGYGSAFTWSDGTEAEFFKWAANEPSGRDRSNTLEDCVQLWHNTMTWNDNMCGRYMASFCKAPISNLSTTAEFISITMSTPQTTTFVNESSSLPATDTEPSKEVIAQPLTATENTGLSAGKILAILVGIGACAIIIVAVVLVVRRLQGGATYSPEPQGFINALYHRSHEAVSIKHQASTDMELKLSESADTNE